MWKSTLETPSRRATSTRTASDSHLSRSLDPRQGSRTRPLTYCSKGTFDYSLPPDSTLTIQSQGSFSHTATASPTSRFEKDTEWTYKEAIKRGAKGIRAPTSLKDDHGVLKGSAISAYGDTVHTFIERDGYKGVFAPGFVPIKGNAEPVGLQRVDHVVANVEEGKMDYWVEFYGKVFGFSQLISFDDKDISTEYSALRSKVMRNPSGTVKFPINEPAKGKRKSQIQEYLDYFKGAGVQHLAISTDNLIATVSRLQQRGIEFLNTPDSYYAELPKRIGGISERIDDLKKLRILVDKDEKGYMLQIFTKPLQDRPTLFFELIQRRGSESFGKGNFKALFESIEQEQAKRGNL